MLRRWPAYTFHAVAATLAAVACNSLLVSLHGVLRCLEKPAEMSSWLLARLLLSSTVTGGHPEAML